MKYFVFEGCNIFVFDEVQLYFLKQNYLYVKFVEIRDIEIMFYVNYYLIKLCFILLMKKQGLNYNYINVIIMYGFFFCRQRLKFFY